MDSTMHVTATVPGTPRPAPAGHDRRLPWPALLTMAVTVFVVVSGEMMPTAVLPAMTADLGVSLAQGGLLVSGWAATVVVASFPLARLTARFDRSRVIGAALLVVVLATLLTAAAGSYGPALTSRLVAAAATGLLWSTVNAHAASIVPERQIARAAAVVLGGGTLGTVGGIPAGNALADTVGWRVAFVALAVLGLLAALAVVVVLPRFPEVGSAAGGTTAQGRRPLWPVLATTGLGGLVLVAHFMVFTFVAELLRPSPVPTPALLLVFGTVSAGGVALVGAASDRYPAGVPVTVAAGMVLSLVGVAAVGGSGGLDLAVVVAWGMATGAVGPAVQAAAMRVAGPEHRVTAGTLMPVAMNLGIAVGSAAGSGVVDLWSTRPLPLLAVVPVLFAVGGFALVGRLTTPGVPAAASRG